MENIANFLNQFVKVFDEELNIKACGRADCVRLIELAEILKSDTDFGDKSTGMMNVDNLISLYNEVV